MPLYYFILRNGADVIPDREGVELPNQGAARLYATTVAHELMRNRESLARSWRIEILDDYLQPRFKILFAEIDDTLDHLTPNARLMVETTCRRLSDMHDAFNEVRASLNAVIETLAQADSHIAALSRGARQEARFPGSR